ncbi:hypothetical protein Tco_0907743 [Tanacetum coccineum]|uniref:Uncharacterized protein n=1 Tax=Tanacetum coccineum TaxID=301880 RepID=A0ABQ5CMC7_9ASTR
MGGQSDRLDHLRDVVTRVDTNMRLGSYGTVSDTLIRALDGYSAGDRWTESSMSFGGWLDCSGAARDYAHGFSRHEDSMGAERGGGHDALWRVYVDSDRGIVVVGCALGVGDLDGWLDAVGIIHSVESEGVELNRSSMHAVERIEVEKGTDELSTQAILSALDSTQLGPGTHGCGGVQKIGDVGVDLVEDWDGGGEMKE